MTSWWSDDHVLWALVLVVVLPLAIIAVSELAERLRQRDSPLRRAALMVRNWVLPLGAVWLLAVTLFDLDGSRPGIRVLATALLVSIAATALSIIAVLIDRHRHEVATGARRELPRLVLAMPRLVVLLTAAWFLLDGVWGVDLSAALTALGVTSLVVSFALQDTLSGLASGFLLLADQPFKPGDWIEAGDVTGRVVDMNWRSSRIQDRNGDLIVVPNGELANGTIVNFDQPSRVHRVVVPVQVAFVNPPTLAKEMLLDAARSTPGVLADPPPEIRVVQIDDPLMGYEAQLWIDDYSIAPKVAADFGSLVWYMSHRHDVPLPSPAQDLYLYDGVQAGLAGVPDQAELRRRVTRSPLLAQLEDPDLDRLVGAAMARRYAAGEVILDAAVGERDLYVLWSGQARLEVQGPDGSTLVVAEAKPSDVLSVIPAERDRAVAPRFVALTDCEVVVVEASVAGTVTSRNPDLARALDQVVTGRRRRVERIVGTRGRALAALESSEAVPEDEPRGG